MINKRNYVLLVTLSELIYTIFNVKSYLLARYVRKKIISFIDNQKLTFYIKYMIPKIQMFPTDIPKYSTYSSIYG